MTASFCQVDLGLDKLVTGVVIQGGKHYDKNVFMKKFKVGHSLDGEDWTLVNEENTTKPKVSPRKLKTVCLCPFSFEFSISPC